MWLLADILNTGMLLAGIGLLTIIMLRRTYRYYGRQRSRSKAAAPYLTQVPRPAQNQRSLSDAPPDVLSWQVELHDTARELKAELDSKMRALQLLIGQARHEANRLEQILSQLDPSLRTPSPDSSTNSPSNWLPGSPDRQAEIFALADQGRSAAEIAEQVSVPLGEIELILSLRSTHQ